MLIKIGDFEFTEVWDGILYKKLSQYPAVSDWKSGTSSSLWNMKHPMDGNARSNVRTQMF